MSEKFLNPEERKEYIDFIKKWGTEQNRFMRYDNMPDAQIKAMYIKVFDSRPPEKKPKKPKGSERVNEEQISFDVLNKDQEEPKTIEKPEEMVFDLDTKEGMKAYCDAAMAKLMEVTDKATAERKLAGILKDLGYDIKGTPLEVTETGLTEADEKAQIIARGKALLQKNAERQKKEEEERQKQKEEGWGTIKVDPKKEYEMQRLRNRTIQEELLKLWDLHLESKEFRDFTPEEELAIKTSVAKQRGEDIDSLYWFDNVAKQEKLKMYILPVLKEKIQKAINDYEETEMVRELTKAERVFIRWEIEEYGRKRTKNEKVAREKPSGIEDYQSGWWASKTDTQMIAMLRDRYKRDTTKNDELEEEGLKI